MLELPPPQSDVKPVQDTTTQRQIRQATAADAPAVAALSNRLIRDTLVTFTSKEQMVTEVAGRIAARQGQFLVAIEQGRVAGFATYGPFREGPGYRFCVEHSIQLADWARGRGIGYRLMQRLIAIARDTGLHVMIAAISSANPRAVVFHERLGFETVGQLPEVGHKKGQWLDLILMQKRLNHSPSPSTAPPASPV